MSWIRDKVTKYLDINGWHYRSISTNVIAINVSGRNHDWIGYINIDQPRNLVWFHSVANQVVSPLRLHAVAELIVHLNYSIPVGNFDLNFGTGEVRFKTSFWAQEEQSLDASIKWLLQLNLLAMDYYLPLIDEVASTTIEPLQALRNHSNRKPHPPE